LNHNLLIAGGGGVAGKDIGSKYEPDFQSLPEMCDELFCSLFTCPKLFCGIPKLLVPFKPSQVISSASSLSLRILQNKTVAKVTHAVNWTILRPVRLKVKILTPIKEWTVHFGQGRQTAFSIEAFFIKLTENGVEILTGLLEGEGLEGLNPGQLEVLDKSSTLS